MWTLELGGKRLPLVKASSWDGFYNNTGHPCEENNTCANEACLVYWFTGYINAVKPNYTAYFQACNPQFCEVVFQKSLVSKVVSFLSTLGGLWHPLYMGTLALWLLLAKLPWLAAGSGQQQQQQQQQLQQQFEPDQVITITAVQVCESPSVLKEA
jgi:hypothetical protein